MIGHDHVSPKRNIKFSNGAMSVLLKIKLGTTQRRNTFAVASSKSDEVKWLLDANQA